MSIRRHNWRCTLTRPLVHRHVHSSGFHTKSNTRHTNITHTYYMYIYKFACCTELRIYRNNRNCMENHVSRNWQWCVSSKPNDACVMSRRRLCYFFFYLLLYSSLCSALTYTEGRNGEIGNARRTKESNAHRIVAEACIALYTTQIAHNHCVYGWLWNNLAQRISLASQWRLG